MMGSLLEPLDARFASFGGGAVYGSLPAAPEPVPAPDPFPGVTAEQAGSLLTSIVDAFKPPAPTRREKPADHTTRNIAIGLVVAAAAVFAWKRYRK